MSYSVAIAIAVLLAPVIVHWGSRWIGLCLDFRSTLNGTLAIALVGFVLGWGDPSRTLVSMVFVTGLLGLLHHYLGVTGRLLDAARDPARQADALGRIERKLRVWKERGKIQSSAADVALAALAYAEAGQSERARDVLALVDADKLRGDPALRFANNAAVTALRLGDQALASAVLARVEQVQPRSKLMATVLQSTRAVVLAVRGEAEQAQVLIDEMGEIGSQLRGTVSMARAHILAARGDEAAAAAMFTEMARTKQGRLLLERISVDNGPAASLAKRELAGNP